MWRSVLYALRNALVLLMAAFLVTPVRVSAQDTSEQAGKTQPDGSLPSLQTCIRELRDWRSNWGTIRISSHEWNLKDMAECNPDADPNAPDYIEKHSPRYEFAWANWGALRHKYTTIQAGKVHSVTSRGTNTEYSWKGSHVFEAPQDAPLSSSRIVVPFHGLWFARPGCWLDRELEDNPWTVLGWEDVDGHRCVKIYLTDGQHTKTLWEHSNTLWLDPGFRYLPRKRMKLARKLGKWQQDDTTTEWEFAEPSREFADPFTGKIEWVHVYTWHVTRISEVDGTLFPTRGTFKSRRESDVTEWEIDQVLVNEGLERTFFTAPKHRADASGVDQSEESAPNSTSPTVEPEPEQSLWNWLTLTGILCLVGGLGVGLWRRRMAAG